MPGDKSLSHRAALFAALAEGDSRIENMLVAGVSQSMLSALRALGITWELHDSTLEVMGKGLAGFKPPNEALQCGNSATTMRLLAGALVAAGIPATLDGSNGLRRRPMKRIVEPLKRMGAPIEAAPGDYPPLVLGSRLRGTPLDGIEYKLPVASAQVKTTLLLAGLAARTPITLVEPGPSRDHTERLLSSLGVEISKRPLKGEGFPVEVTLRPPHGALLPLNMRLPGDISSAAFLIVAAAITPGSQVIIKDVGLNPTRTGLLEVLQCMGADIQIIKRGERHNEPYGDIRVAHSQLHGVNVEGQLVVRMIDEFPAFAIAAAFAASPTVVRNAEELRHKESDRISALCQGLNALGASIHETPDGFELPGGNPPHGGLVHPFGDHRLAMAFAIAGLAAAQPVTVQEAEIIHESFPGFSGTLQRLGANIQI